MTEARVPDMALLEVGDGATPTEVFTVVCGVFAAGISRSATTSEKFRRDCNTPFAPPRRVVTVTGKQASTSGTGVINVSQIALFMASLGVKKSYNLKYYEEDALLPGAAGKLMGTYAGKATLVTDEENADIENDGTKSISIEWDGIPTWTIAP
jgi:hypothetical protein